MNSTPEDFILIEKCFAAIQAKKDIRGNLARIERTLSRHFDLHFNISIVNNTSHQFFGMSIYPAISTMDRIINAIVVDKSKNDIIVDLWQKTDEWFLEIDSIALYDKNLNANPQELCGLLLHEIGHVIQSNTVPTRVNRIIRYKMTDLTYMIKKLLGTDKVRKLFNLTIIEACNSKCFKYKNLQDEMAADNNAIRYGYSDALDSLFRKILIAQGGSYISRTEDDVDGDVRVVVNWTIENIQELEFRKSALRTSLRTQMLQTPSDFIKKNIDFMYKTFFGDNTDNYRKILSEAYFERPRDVLFELKSDEALIKFKNRIVQESIEDAFDKLGKLKKITQTDIDIIYVEIDKIETHDDKIYTLDKISDKMEIVELGIEYLATNRANKVTQTQSTLISFKKQLEELREAVLKIKVVEKQYGVFVKYPKGYEG